MVIQVSLANMENDLSEEVLKVILPYPFFILCFHISWFCISFK